MNEQLELLVTLEFALTDSSDVNSVFDSLVLQLEEFRETSVFDIDALLDGSSNRIAIAASSSGSSFKDAELRARATLEELFARSLTSASEGVLVSVSAEARPEKLLSSL